MTDPRRLTNLPGYDTAPDIYETPDLTDDAASTTLTQQTSPAPSESSETSSEEDEDVESRVNRRRLYPERARSRFAVKGDVDARRADWSDRVDGRRRGYGVRRTRGADGEEEEEGLEARIARLRREIEECRVLAAAEVEVEQADDGDEGGVEELSKLLAGVEPSIFRKRSLRPTSTGGTPGGAWPEAQQSEDITDAQTLNRVTDFDSRLSALEQALGLTALDSTHAHVDALSTPILPSLTRLDHQLSALTSATSLTNLEAASTRVSKLREEADSASASHAETSEPGGGGEGDQDLPKLRALYTFLPTLQSLSPTVPALLARLRSLRTLHTAAATAASELEEVENRQEGMEAELKAWREGLEKVEQAVGEADQANGRNGKVVGMWVRELEGRVEGLG